MLDEIITNLQFTPSSDQACLNLGTGAFSNQNSQPIPVEFGDCYEFQLHTLINDKCIIRN